MRRAPRSGFVFALGFSTAISLGAGAAWAGDPARDLGDIDPATSKDVDDANTAEPQDLDQVLGDGSEDQHIVDSNAPDADATSAEGKATDSKPLDEADADAPEWQPPACDGVEVDLGSRPPASDVDGWRGELQNAEAALDKARTKLAAADAEYTYARNRKAPRGEALKQIIDVRDKARKEFASARCSLPARVEEARRLGVPPEVWRDFPASME
jgi:hypothetical protein